MTKMEPTKHNPNSILLYTIIIQLLITNTHQYQLTPNISPLVSPLHSSPLHSSTLHCSSKSYHMPYHKPNHKSSSSSPFIHTFIHTPSTHPNTHLSTHLSTRSSTRSSTRPSTSLSFSLSPPTTTSTYWITRFIYLKYLLFIHSVSFLISIRQSKGLLSPSVGILNRREQGDEEGRKKFAPFRSDVGVAFSHWLGEFK